MTPDVSETNHLNPISNLMREGKSLIAPPPFKPSEAPLAEIARLSRLGHDLTTPQNRLEKLVFDPSDTKNDKQESHSHKKTNSNLRFEGRACGTPIPQETFQNDTSHASSSLDPIFGAELLKTFSTRPLSGPARVEALRRLTVAMANPTRQNLESVLMILVTDDPNHSQFKT